MKSNIGGMEARRLWVERLSSSLAQLHPKSGRLRVGIVGALGSGDVGDEAMLVSLVEELKARLFGVEFLAFSVNPGLTYAYTSIPTVGLLSTYLSPTSDLRYLLARLAGGLEERVERILLRRINIEEVDRGQRIRRFFLESRSKKILRRCLDMGESDMSKVHPHAKDVAGLDALVVLGGAYLNSWNVKSGIYEYLLPARVAALYKVPVFGGGLNLGPYNRSDAAFIKGVLSNFELIGCRDNAESIRALRDLGIFDDSKHLYSCDDAISLVPEYTSEVDRFIDFNSPYIAFNVHYWKLDSEKWELFSRQLAQVLAGLVARYKCKIVPISMAFSDARKGLDDAAIHDVLRVADLPSGTVVHPEGVMSIGKIKGLYAKARITIATRHHPMVLSVSSGVPTLSIAFDDYYRMKLEGVGAYFPGLFSVVYGAQEFGLIGLRVGTTLWDAAQ